MSFGLLIAGGGLTTAAAVGIALRRRRELTRLRDWAQRHEWSISAEDPKDLLWRIRNTLLTQFGHSRRITEVLTTEGRMYLFMYVCETGFEHQRQSHRWHVVLCETEHRASRASMTGEDWLAIAANSPMCRELAISAYAEGTGKVPATSPGCQAIVDDAQEWEARLRGGLAEWFLHQPAKRNWEILPGLVMGYEPRSRDESAVVDLVQAAQDLVGRLSR